MSAPNATKSYADAAKSPPPKSQKQAAQGASSNNGGRSADTAHLTPPPDTASHFPPVDSRVEKSAKNQPEKFAAGGNQTTGARRSGSQHMGSQYEPGTEPPPNKRATYPARVFTANRKANDPRDNSVMRRRQPMLGSLILAMEVCNSRTSADERLNEMNGSVVASPTRSPQRYPLTPAAMA